MPYGQYLTKDKRGSRWIFRIHTPKDLREDLPDEYRQSTGTHCKRTAIRVARVFAIEFTNFFDGVRKLAGDEKKIKLLKQIHRGRVTLLKAKHNDELSNAMIDKAVAEFKADQLSETLNDERTRHSRTLDRVLSTPAAPTTLATPLPETPAQFSELVDSWLPGRIKSVKERTDQQITSAAETWKLFFHDKYCHEIKRIDLATAFNLVNNRPNEVDAKHKLSKHELIDLALNGHDYRVVKHNSRKTILRTLRETLKTAYLRGHTIDDLSSLADTKSLENDDIKVTRLPFTDNEIEAIFSNPQTGKGISSATKHWILPILALTGCRRGEALQWTVADIEQCQDTEIPYFRIDNRFEGQSLKTLNSRRNIPVHSKLLKMGFEDFVAQRRKQDGKHARLFEWPLPGREGDVSEWFSRLLKKLKIESKGIDWTKSLHSLRHNVGTHLGNKGFDDADIGMALGHITQSQRDGLVAFRSSTTDRYNHSKKVLELKHAQEIIESIQYPNVNFAD